MCKKLIYLVSVVLLLGSVSNAEDIQWTDLGPDHLWSTPENWDLGRVPTLADDVRIDVPAAGAPNGPVIQDGIDAKANGIFNEAPGEPMLTITGGTLEVADWIWWGDGADSFGIWEMSGGTVSVVNEFELGWGGGAGTLTMTGGTINAGEAVIPTGSGAFGELYLHGGTYNVTKADGLSVKENGLIDITEGTLVLEGDDTAKINDLITAGLITAYGGDGKFELDFDGRNPGKTTLTAIPVPEPVNPGTEGLVAHYAFENNANDSSGNELHGTIVGDPIFIEGLSGYGMALDFDGIDDLVELGKFDVVGGITLSTWIKPDDFEINDARIITKAKEWGGDDHWWMLSTISETSLRFRLKTDEGPTTATLISDPVLEAGVFTHVATTWDGNMMRIYKDGVEVASQEKGGFAVAVDPDVSVAIGSQPSNAFASDPSHVVKFFDGLIDDVRIYERALSEGEILYLAGKRATPVDPGTDGLIAFYALDGDANDSSGNELHGTIVGEPTFVEGQVGMALELDGIDDYVDIGNPSLLDFGTGDFTISAWINMTAIERGTVYAKGGDNSGGIRYTLAMGEGENDGKMTLTTDDDSTKVQAMGGTVVNDGAWHHVVGMRRGNTSLVYVDGDKDGTIDLPEGYDLSGTTQHNALLGAITSHTDGSLEKYFAGLLDEVAIYGRALSAGEIRYLAGFREADTLSGLADVTVVDGAIVSVRHEGTEYVVADGDLILGTTTRWYVDAGVETLWAEGDPAPAATVSGTSSPKDGDVGSKADNFLFTLDGGTNISSIDGIDFQDTIFPSLTDTIFLFERGGNDVGTWQAIYADGSLGVPVAFDKASAGGPYADTGISVNGQNAYGVVFKTSVPVQGVRITASGHDTLSISTPLTP